MNKKTSLSRSRKMCAMLLSLMMVVGTITVAFASEPQNANSHSISNNSAATPDNAEKPVETATNQPVAAEQFPCMNFNSEAVSAKVGDMVYLSGKNFNSIEMKFEPATEHYKNMEAEISNGFTNNFDVILQKNNEGSRINSNCNFSAADGIVTIVVNINEIYPSGIQPDSYSIVVEYNSDGVDLKLSNEDFKFKVINKAPVVSNIKYNGLDKPEWTKENVDISFDVSSEILESVTVNGEVPQKSESESAGVSKYVYTAQKSGKYTIVAYDALGNGKDKEILTEELLIDKNKPVIPEAKFYTDNDREIGINEWKERLVIKTELTDAESGIDVDSISVKSGEKNIEFSTSSDSSKIILSINADERQDYEISCKDLAGNENNSTIKAEDIRIDKEAPRAEDFTLEFSSSQTGAEKVLNFLSFGLYSNNDINLKIDVDSNGLSEIKNIKLFNGDEEIEAEGENFVLKAPEGDDSTVKYDLYVQAEDSVGNSSGKLNIKTEKINTKVTDGVEEDLKKISNDLFEIIISNIAPVFSDNGIMFNFDKKVEVESEESPKIHIAGNGKVGVTVSEPISGIKSVTATLKGTGDPVTVFPSEEFPSEDFSAQKITKCTPEFKLPELESGEYTLTFIAESNSGNKEPCSKSFIYDEEAPVLVNNKFNLSNVDNGKQKWTKDGVTIQFELSDTTGIESVEYYYGEETSEPDGIKTVEKSEDGKYSFTVNAYGVYTVVAMDKLGNEKSYSTDIIQYDNTAPFVVDDKFDFNSEWTNKPVKVSFQVKDLPDPDCSGVLKVTVDGKTEEINNDGKGNYSFNAENYGTYKVQVFDVAGNESSEYTVGPINIDKIKPEIASVKFGSVKNNKSFGLYTNETLEVTVTVKNVLNASNAGSDINLIKIFDKKGDTKKELASGLTSNDDGTYSLSYKIDKSENPLNLSFYAEDKAGNSIEKNISDSDLNVYVDDSAKDCKDLYEVVVTLQKAVIDINVKFENGTFKNSAVNDEGETVYSGKGTFTAEISDELSGIDAYDTYFVKTSEIKFDSDNNITNLDDLAPYKKTTDKISDSEKTVSKSVEFSTPDKNELESGEYTAIVAVRNLSGNETIKYKNIIVDNSAPEITKIEITTNGGDADTIADYGIYSSESINVNVICDDGNYTAGIESINLFNALKEIAGDNESGEFTLTANNEAYMISASVTDIFGNTKGELDIRSISLSVNGIDLVVRDNFEIRVYNDSEKTSVNGFEFADFSNHKANSEIYGGNGVIKSRIYNEVLGVKSVEVMVNDRTLVAGTDYDISYEYDSDNARILAANVDTKSSCWNNETGSYNLEYKVTDYCGNIKKFNKEFQIDNTAPKVKSIEYISEFQAADKLLNILTFGLYSSENINVKVTVEDAEPSSGINSEGIRLSSETGKSVIDGTFDLNSNSKTFALSVGEDEKNSFYNDLKITVKDIFGNTDDPDGREFRSYYDEEKDIFVLPDQIKDSLNSNFDIVATSNKPEFDRVTGMVYNFDNMDTSADTVIHVNGNGTIGVNVKDVVSGIANVTARIDGNLVYESEDLSKGENKVIEFFAEFSPSLTSGRHSVEFIAKSNNGLTNPYSESFVYDSEAPVLFDNNFNYSPEGWTNNNVTVSFVLTDNTDIASVTYYHGDDKYSPDKSEIKSAAKGENGEFSFIADKYGKYTVIAVDTLGNETVYTTSEVLYDNEPPVIVTKDGKKFNLSNDVDGTQAWTNKDVTVSFTASDKPDDHYSGIDSITIDNANEIKGNGVKENDFSFKADHYGEYAVDIYDVAKNKSEQYVVEPVKIDKVAPVIKKVEFAAVKNNMNYGLYTNQALQMIVTVNNDEGFEGPHSPLESIKIIDENSGNEIKSTFIDNNDGKYSATCVIDVSDNPRKLKLFAKDIAGNETENYITDSSVQVYVDDSAKDCKDLYEVVVTLQKAVIDINVKFENGTFKNSAVNDEGETVYSGKGTFTAEISDELSGIDAYDTYFVKTSEIKFDSDNNITNLDDLAPYKKTTDKISDSEKTVSKSVEFSTPDKNELESGEYTAIVAVRNLSGNETIKYKNIIVDNSAPEITKIEITTNGGDADTIADYGIYSSESINVNVICDDGDYTAGLESIKLNPIGDNITGAFVITLSDNPYTLSASVTDVFGNSNGTFDITDENIPVYINNGSKADLLKNFEIVVSNDSTNIKNDGFKFDFAHHQENSNLYGGSGTISSKITNEFSGVKEVAVMINDKILSADEDYKLTFAPDDDGEKNVLANIAVNSSAWADKTGYYKVTYTVTDYCGNENTFEENFQVDNTAPVVSKISYSDDDNLFDKLLNILTFGIYSSNKITVTVTAEDVNFGGENDNMPSSDIDKNGIVVSSQTGKNVAAGNFDEESNSKTFTLEAGDNENYSFYNDLRVYVVDKFGNTNNENGREFRSYYNDDEKDIFNLPDKVLDSLNRDENFDIVVTKAVPNIYKITATGTNMYNKTSNNTLWFSDNPVINFSVSDSISKIHSVKVELNGEDVTTDCTYNGGKSLPTEFTNFNSNSGDKIENVAVTLNTAKHNLNVNNIENKVVVTATGNNGIPVTSSEFVFYVDKSNPYITAFEFSEGQIDGNEKPVGKNVEATAYGYYFKNETIVTVTSSDGEFDDAGVGVDYIGFRRVDINGTETVYKTVMAENNKASFTVPANFKGEIFAYAVDFVKNNENISDEYTPENVIVETQAQHDANSYVNISKPSTGYKDINGRELYTDNVDVTIEVASTYAGIKTVEYKVDAAYDIEHNYSKTYQVNKNGEISDWTVMKKEANIATVLQKTITVSNNSNDIKVWVRVTDRAGFSTEKDITFSIDKVNPKIEVKYDVNEPNKLLGEDFYKTDRTATVTVTERNFKADNFIEKITNTEAFIPPLAAGTNWTSYTPDSSNPDSTVHIATFTFNSDGDYTFDCSFTDLAGRKAQDYGTDKFTIDKTAPKISVNYDVNNSNDYYNTQRTATITIEEHNFYAEYADIKQIATGPDNSTSVAPPAVSGWSTTGDVSKATITFANDGKYSFTVDFRDKALNEAVQDKESEFYIDTKIDKIEIVNVEDMTAYDGTVAPVINYFDNNYESSEYSLKRVDFGKDPETVTNISPSDGPVSGYSRVVAYSDFDKVVENDGIYMLHASIKDRAGNTDEKDVLFSVNRFGSTFTIFDEATKELVSEKYYTNNAPDIVITEINVNEVSNPVIQVNRDDSTQTLTSGSDYTVQQSGGKSNWHSYNYTVFSKNFENEGNYVVIVSSTDHFKNVVSNRTAYKETEEGKTVIDRTYPVSFVVDKTDPIVTISGIESDQYYEEAEKTVTVTCDDANISSENLKIEFDGKELTRDDYELSETAGSVEVKLNLEADGNTDDRAFKVSITDKAGNSNKDGIVERFRLSASWIARVLHYQLPLVIILSAVLLALIGLGIFFIVKKRKKNSD